MLDEPSVAVELGRAASAGCPRSPVEGVAVVFVFSSHVYSHAFFGAGGNAAFVAYEPLMVVWCVVLPAKLSS